MLWPLRIMLFIIVSLFPYASRFIASICCSIFYIWSARFLCHAFAQCLAHSRGVPTPKFCLSPTTPARSAKLNGTVWTVDSSEKCLISALSTNIWVVCLLMPAIYGRKNSGLGGQAKGSILLSAFLGCKHHCQYTEKKRQFWQKLCRSSLSLWRKTV